MKSLRIYGLVFTMSLMLHTKAWCQYSWDWRDPNDFDFIDFGDNKLIGYNALGFGLTLWLDPLRKSNFDKSKVLSFSFGRYHEYLRDPLSDIWTVEGRIGTSLRKYVSLGGGVRTYLIEGADVHTGGLGGFIWFTWHIVRTKHFRLSYDNGVGPNYFFIAFPAGGTKFNFTTHYGIDLAVRAGNHWVTLSLGNIHISNAGIKGVDRNPAMDAIGIQLGYIF